MYSLNNKVIKVNNRIFNLISKNFYYKWLKISKIINLLKSNKILLMIKCLLVSFDCVKNYWFYSLKLNNIWEGSKMKIIWLLKYLIIVYLTYQANKKLKLWLKPLIFSLWIKLRSNAKEKKVEKLHINYSKFYAIIQIKIYRY